MTYILVMDAGEVKDSDVMLSKSYPLIYLKHKLYLTVKPRHLCATNFMNYIPIFLQLLKELPW